MRSISRFSVLSILSHRWAQCLMCGEGATRVEETGELRRWFRERLDLEPAAARKKGGAAGEEITDSVALEVEGHPGLALKVAAMEISCSKRWWKSSRV